MRTVAAVAGAAIATQALGLEATPMPRPQVVAVGSGGLGRDPW